MNDRTPFIRKSPAILAIKILMAELVTELLYLLLYVLLVFLGNQGIVNDTAPLKVLLTTLDVISSIGIFIAVIAIWTAEGLKITEKELIEKHGVLKSHRTSYPYVNMQRVSVHQTLIGKLFKFGTINVYMAVLGKEVIFSDYSDPHQLAANIKEGIPAEENQYLIRP